MRTLTLLLLVTLLAACATVSTQKMESGDRSLGERMVVNLDAAWNKVALPNTGPAQTWTMEGLPVDQLLIYSGVKDGEVIHGTVFGSKLKSFAFRSAMQPDEIVAMFEGMLTRDGSAFKLVKLEPSSFGGAKGLRFEYSVIRKVDNVRLSGVGYASVNGGELFAMVYSAPQLGFFPRHQANVQQIAQSARISLKPGGGMGEGTRKPAAAQPEPACRTQAECRALGINQK